MASWSVPRVGARPLAAPQGFALPAPVPAPPYPYPSPYPAAPDAMALALVQLRVQIMILTAMIAQFGRPAAPGPVPPAETPRPVPPKPEAPAGRGPSLRLGDAGKPVRALQQRLKDLGHYQGPVDGLFGLATVAAVRDFQKARQLAGNGRVGPGTWKALGVVAKGHVREPRGTGPMLKLGHWGLVVKQLQNRLRALGFDPGPSDGEFGPRTEAAVKWFQAWSGLKHDGVVGAQTWRRLGIHVKGKPHAPVVPAVSGGPAAQRLVASAMRFLGQPYLWGGGHGATFSGPGPVDCSGLVTQAARLAGLNLDGTAAVQQRLGQAVSMSALQPGDLLFHGSPASHVGIYLGGGRVIHAPKTGDVVRIVDLASYHYFDNARRVL